MNSDADRVQVEEARPSRNGIGREMKNVPTLASPRNSEPPTVPAIDRKTRVCYALACNNAPT